MPDQVKQLEDLAEKSGLVISGIMSLEHEDGFPKRFQSIALLSPDPNGFWSSFSTSEQANDGRADPIDRWSRDTILAIADKVGGFAIFPFEGPPYHPFSTWAQRAGVAWQSPSGLLVHADYGLWISFRGAVALDETAKTISKLRSPCETCARPCLEACPVNAISEKGFDHASCLEHVRAQEGADCANFGCLARRACPVGQSITPPQPQIKLHMRAFKGE